MKTKEDLLALEAKGKRLGFEDAYEIEQQLYHEARLLDEERMDEWVELLGEDLIYWMPIRENHLRKHRKPEISPDRCAMFDETREFIKIRLRRNDSGMCWTEDPPTRHVYAISNVEAFETDVSNEIEVHSVFSLYRSRFERDDSFLMGRRKDIWRKNDNGSYELAARLILIQQSTLLCKSLNVFF